MHTRQQSSLKKKIEKRKARAQLVDVEDTDKGENKDRDERDLNLDTGIDLKAKN